MDKLLPVAWMSQGGDVTRSKDYFEEMGFKDLTPLYTEPQYRELSDEETEEIVKQWFNCHPEESLTSIFPMPLYSVVSLCKAILKKASEK